MGIQTMSSQGGGQQSLSQALAHKSSWYNFTLSDLENQLRDLGKPLGSMNLDELINVIWMAEASQPTGMNVESQRQASITVARAFSGKTVDEVWRDIQQGKKNSFGKEIKCERDLPLGEMTLEDFLVEAGIFAKTSFSSAVRLNMVDGLSPQDFSQEMDISPTPSMGTLSDTSTSGRKRDVPDALERTAERRLRRKIKNRESAARSRARKQAYHNELVSKVSCLEEENTRLKKEKPVELFLPRLNSLLRILSLPGTRVTKSWCTNCGNWKLCCPVNCFPNQSTSFEEQVQLLSDLHCKSCSLIELL